MDTPKSVRDTKRSDARRASKKAVGPPKPRRQPQNHPTVRKYWSTQRKLLNAGPRLTKGRITQEEYDKIRSEFAAAKTAFDIHKGVDIPALLAENERLQAQIAELAARPVPPRPADPEFITMRLPKLPPADPAAALTFSQADTAAIAARAAQAAEEDWRAAEERVVNHADGMAHAHLSAAADENQRAALMEEAMDAVRGLADPGPRTAPLSTATPGADLREMSSDPRVDRILSLFAACQDEDAFSRATEKMNVIWHISREMDRKRMAQERGNALRRLECATPRSSLEIARSMRGKALAAGRALLGADIEKSAREPGNREMLIAALSKHPVVAKLQAARRNAGFWWHAFWKVVTRRAMRLAETRHDVKERIESVDPDTKVIVGVAALVSALLGAAIVIVPRMAVHMPEAHATTHVASAADDLSPASQRPDAFTHSH